MVSPLGCYFDSNVPEKISDYCGELGTYEIGLRAVIEFERDFSVERC